jgi:hypothetical protein
MVSVIARRCPYHEREWDADMLILSSLIEQCSISDSDTVNRAAAAAIVGNFITPSNALEARWRRRYPADYGQRLGFDRRLHIRCALSVELRTSCGVALDWLLPNVMIADDLYIMAKTPQPTHNLYILHAPKSVVGL